MGIIVHQISPPPPLHPSPLFYLNHHSMPDTINAIRFRYSSIPINLHRSWEREITPPILSHINEEPSRPGDLLQLTLWTWCSSQIVETANDFQHSSYGSHRSIFSEASMCPDPIVDVGVQGAVETDFIGGREDHWIAGCSDLGGLSVRGDAR